MKITDLYPADLEGTTKKMFSDWPPGLSVKEDFQLGRLFIQRGLVRLYIFLRYMKRLPDCLAGRERHDGP